MLWRCVRVFAIRRLAAIRRSPLDAACPNRFERGAARFDAQFVSTPINLSDRYVVPVPMSASYRLLSNGTKFTNLYITGDWIDCGFNAGCIEATVMSGKQAARAISGNDIDIPGEKDL